MKAVRGGDTSLVGRSVNVENDASDNLKLLDVRSKLKRISAYYTKKLAIYVSL